MWYDWDFGDGVWGGNTVFPSYHVYNWSDNFIVRLRVYDTLGNYDDYNEVLSISQIPSVGFWGDPNPTCPGTTIEFNNWTWPINAIYLWTFGDDDSSDFFNPTHTYADTGIYSVTLIGSNYCGSDTMTDTIWILTDQWADFGFWPDTACPNQNIEFNNWSLPEPIANLWSFGDGDSSNAFNPVHAYTNTGIYVVTLVSYSDCGSDMAFNVITINDSMIPNVSTSRWPDMLCPASPVYFWSSSTGIFSYFWDFGDGDFSFIKNPTHSFADTGTYMIIFTGTNTCGYSNNDTLWVSIVDTIAPNANFWPEPGWVCPGDSVTFNNWTWPEPLSNLWYFGDGDSSTASDPKHVYDTLGAYPVTLITTNTCGVSDTIIDTVWVDNGAIPSVWFWYEPWGLICPGTPISFLLSASDTNNVFWDFGDGDTSVLANPKHVYADTGTYTVIAIVTNNCGNSNFYVQTITISYGILPFVNIWVGPQNGCLGTTFNFWAWSSNPNEVIWYFGDGDTAIGDFISHTYTIAGNYSIMAVVSTLCGNDTDYVYVSVSAGPVANFNNTTVCIGDTTSFTDISTGSPYQWRWDFGDGDTSTAQNPSHYYTSPGLYDVTLIVSDSFCSNFITNTIRVGRFPKVNLGIDTIVCTSLLLNAQNAGASYLWNTGDSVRKIPVNTTGIYWVDVISPVGCITRDSINITLTGVKVNLNVFLEGAYTSGGMMSDSLYLLGYLDTLFLAGGVAPINMAPGYPIPSDTSGNAVDVIAIQIRSTNLTTILDTAYAWLMQDGTIRDFQTGQKKYALLCGLVPGEYYIVVMHRNHLSIMYSDSVTLDNTPPPAIDLTTIDSIYGGGAGFLGDGPYGMWAANARNSDQEINGNDLYDVNVDRDALLSGYNLTDVNLSGTVNANDFNKTSYNNDQLYWSTVP